MAAGKSDKVLSLRFNQDQQLFICANNSGVRIFWVDPLYEYTPMSADEYGTIALAEMLFRTRYVAIVGGGRSPKYADNSVLIYNTVREKISTEFMVRLPVIAIRLRRDMIFVISSSIITVYAFPEPKLLFEIRTRDNPSGLCEITQKSCDRALLLFPARKCGAVQIMDLTDAQSSNSQSPIVLETHENDLTCMALNLEGTMLATASEKGTIIRVWDIERRIKLADLRRGTDPATIYCISFSGDSDYLCCSSDKGTVHIYALKNLNMNRRSLLTGIGFLGNYTHPLRAFATIKLPDVSRSICRFGANLDVIVLCYDGSYHKYKAEENGQYSRTVCQSFLNHYLSDEDFIPSSYLRRA